MLKAFHKKNFFFIISIAVFILFAITPLIGNINKASLGFFNADALGIYQKAIIEIAFGREWNPYNPIVNINILNDHFDPAIYIAGLFAKLTSSTHYGLLTFEWVFFLLTGVFLCYKSSSYKHALFGLFLVLFSRGLLQGLEFPLHPTTWSMLPCVVFFYCLFDKKYKAALVAAILMASCRELYYFMFAGVAAYFFLQKDFKQGTLYSVLTLALLFVLFFLRPLMLGPTYQYSSEGIEFIKNADFIGLFKHVVFFDYPLKALVPPLLGILFLYSTKDRRLLLPILFMLPGLAIHVISGRFTAHHTVPFAACLVATVHYFFHDLKKWQVTLLILSFIWTSSSRHTRFFTWAYAESRASKVDADKKHEAIKTLQQLIWSDDLAKQIISTGGILPLLQKPDLKVFHYSLLAPRSEVFDYAVFEKRGTGEPWPLTDNQIETITEACRKSGFNPIIDNEFFIVFQGRIAEECLIFNTIYEPVNDLAIPIK